MDARLACGRRRWKQESLAPQGRRRASDFPKVMKGGWPANLAPACCRARRAFAQDDALRQNEHRNTGCKRERAMDVLQDIVAFIGHAIEAVLIYIESHHWIFGLLALGYVFYLHDRALHARFDALEKRLDEIRKRLAVEY
jgi:hypothetical protein